MPSSRGTPPPIRACLFDMDGLLIDSEDLYTLCTNEVLHAYGRPDIPWSLKAKLQGRPGPEASRILLTWAQLPCTPDEYHTQVRALQTSHFPTTRPLPGAKTLLHTLSTTRPPHKIHLALATSSQRTTYDLKTSHLAPFFSAFPAENKVLGDDPRIPAGRGKPAPDIYLLALETINERLRREKAAAAAAGGSEPAGGWDEIRPEECLVLEDAVPGVEAGRRAGMQVLWCPHEGLLKEYRGREKEVLAGLTGEFEEVGAGGAVVGHGDGSGAPGELDDGWALLVESLEAFPYERFGIVV